MSQILSSIKSIKTRKYSFKPNAKVKVSGGSLAVQYLLYG